MLIKGTAVRIFPKFVEQYYSELFEQWLVSLPAKSKEIFSKEIYASSWYEIYESAIAPIEVLAKLAGLKKEDLAFEIGKFSCEYALRGVYKVFVSISSVSFLMRRSKSIIDTYYDSATTNVQRISDRKILFEFGKLEEKNLLLYYRMKGWIYEFVNYTRQLNPVVDFDYYRDKDNLYTAKFLISW